MNFQTTTDLFTGGLRHRDGKGVRHWIDALVPGTKELRVRAEGGQNRR